MDKHSLSHPNRYAIILAGGSGTRLWPLSRNSKPKQFLCFNDELSLLQKTAQRLIKMVDPSRVFTVTNTAHKFEITGQLHTIHPSLATNVLEEPIAKNTLPAISWAVGLIHRQNPQAIIGVFPSDQDISDEVAFQNAWQSAEWGAAKGYISLFGLKPTSPHTGYGYIHAGPLFSESSSPPVRHVLRFVEKPDLKTAQHYFSSGEYFWNGGIFVFQSLDFLQVLERYQPAAFQITQLLLQNQISRADTILYNQMPETSIDYGLVEKSDKLLVTTADIGWTDLGGWEAVYQHLEKDPEQNVISGDVIALDSSRSLMWSSGKTLATFGISDLIVVQTEDATLICSRDKSDQLKNLIKLLQRQHPHLVNAHATESRPWGSYTVVHESLGYKIKKISVNPKQQLSLQRHQHRSEHWVVLKGSATVQNEDIKFSVKENGSTFIPKGNKHRLSNDTQHVLEIIEIQIGSYLGEDDIERFADIYQRI